MNKIHPTAIVAPEAELGDHNEIGPHCVVGPEVTMGNGNVLRSHLLIEGKAILGNENQCFQFSSLGTEPQDLKYHQEDTLLEVGDNNVFRENVSVHRGTANGGGKTLIGNHNLFMGYVHVAHDCHIGNYNILANYTGLSGHVVLDNYVTLGGQNGVIQFVRIGSYCYFGAGTMVDKHIAPYTTGYGNRITIKSVNVVGLQRRGFSREAINAIRDAHRMLYRSGMNTEEAVQAIEYKYGQIEEVRVFTEFIKDVKHDVKK